MIRVHHYCCYYQPQLLLKPIFFPKSYLFSVDCLLSSLQPLTFSMSTLQFHYHWTQSSNLTLTLHPPIHSHKNPS